MTLSITSAMHSTANSISTVECGGCLKGRTVQNWCRVGDVLSNVLLIGATCLDGAAVGEIYACTKENGKNEGPMMILAVGMPLIIAALILNLVVTRYLPASETIRMNKIMFIASAVPPILHIVGDFILSKSPCADAILPPALTIAALIPGAALVARGYSYSLQEEARRDLI